jgi:hypothetical protein
MKIKQIEKYFFRNKIIDCINLSGLKQIDPFED